jgi:dTDP-4-amino-4,6-dideoxygalactose transaminase
MLLVSEPIVGRDEKIALAEVINCGWITMGERVRAFEIAFAEEHGVRDAVAVNSCTAALHLLLEGLGVGPGDEVLVPSLTFVATANCALYAGATPIFVDIESLDSPLMSLRDAADKCTAKTKAVILMHYAGYLADRAAWREFADARGLLLLEDAAHAAGAAGAGSFGDGAAFSFYGNKNMTTAEGGIVVAREPEVLDRIRQMRAHGMTSGTLERLTSRAATYDVTMLGYNYRMDELRGAIGLAQLKKLKGWNEKRKVLTRMYRRVLADQCPDIRVPLSARENSAHHIMPILLPPDVDRQSVMARLRGYEIQTSIHYPPIHQLSFYRSHYPSAQLYETEQFARRALSLPLHPRMEEQHVDAVSHALANSLMRNK